MGFVRGGGSKGNSYGSLMWISTRRKHTFPEKDMRGIRVLLWPRLSILPNLGHVVVMVLKVNHCQRRPAFQCIRPGRGLPLKLRVSRVWWVFNLLRHSSDLKSTSSEQQLTHGNYWELSPEVSSNSTRFCTSNLTHLFCCCRAECSESQKALISCLVLELGQD